MALIYPKLRTLRMGYAGRVPIQYLFRTPVYSAPLKSSSAASLNSRLLRECLQLRHEDRSGRAWSVRNYPGGYTSYNSRSRLQRISPTFANLESCIGRHVRRFANSLDLDLRGKRLEMTDCWVNIMRHRVAHRAASASALDHQRDLLCAGASGSAGLKFEDPRLERFMAAPPRRLRAREGNRAWVTVARPRGASGAV